MRKLYPTKLAVNSDILNVLFIVISNLRRRFRAGNSSFLKTSFILFFSFLALGAQSQTATTVAVSSSPNPSCFGSDVAFTATITSDLSNATGTVEFFDGATSLGSAPVTSGTTATFVFSTLSVATHSITAVYSGDVNNATSTSAPLSQVVNPATPATPGTITGTIAQCPAGAGKIYSIAAVPGTASYNWTVPTGWTITSSTPYTNSITVTTGAAGQDGDISVTATNTCGTSGPSTLAVTIIPVPPTPGPISGTTSQCPGATGQVYSVTPVAGATSYAWTLPNIPPSGWAVNGGSGTVSITVTTGTVGGNIFVRAVNSCGQSSPRPLAVTVGAGAPANPGSITGTVAQCPGLTGQTYSVAAVTGATGYTWTVPTGWTITSLTPYTNSITVQTGAAGDDGDITVTADNICGSSAVSTLGVTVNPATPATPGAISGTAAQCPALTGEVYSVPDVAGVSYTWSVPTGWTITGGTGTHSITVVTGDAGDDGNITVTAGNSCGTSAAASLPVTVNPGTPATPGAISGTAAQCPVLTGEVYSVPDMAGVNYTWSVPTGWTITGGTGTHSITVVTGDAGDDGNITVTAGNSCGTSAVSSLPVTVNPATPATPGAISGTIAQCPALTGQTYNVAAVSGATSYTWTVPTGWTITSSLPSANSITVTTGNAGDNGNITITADNSCGSSPASTPLAVTVNPGTPATPGAISGTAIQCPVVTGQTYSVTAVPGATSYSWTIPTGWVITTNSGNSIIVTTGAAGQGGNMFVKASNSCGTSAFSLPLAVTVNPGTPATPGAITGSAAQCPGALNQTYSISSVTNATTYTWAVPTGWTINNGTGTNTIQVTAGSAGQNGNITVTAGNSCGTSPQSSAPVTVSLTVPPAPGSISGQVAQCPGTTGQIYSIAAVSGATGYTWIVPTGWTITGGTGTTSITVKAGTAGQNGNITVTANNTCGSGAASSLAVSVNPATPAAPTAQAGTGAACTQITAKWSVSSNATTYYLDVSTSTIFSSFVPGYSNQNVGNITSIDVTGLTAGVTYYYRVRAGNSCGTSASSSRITYATLPATPSAPGSITGTTAQCPALPGQHYSISSVTNATTYAWIVPTGWTITAGQGTINITVTTGAAGQSGNISVTAGNTCGTSSARTLGVTVNALPSIGTQPVAPAAFCAGSGTHTITVSASGAGLGYQWRKGGVNLTNVAPYSGVTTSTLTITSPALAAAGSYDVVITGSCSPSVTSTPVNVTVNAGPTADAGSDIISCAGTATINMTGATAAGTYGSVAWSGGSTLGTWSGSGNNPSTYIFTPNASFPIGSFVATLSVTASTPCSGTVTDTRRITWGAAGSWLGITSTAWTTASNWCGGIPTNSTNVTIPPASSGVLNMPTVNATAACRNITINGTLTGGSSTLTVSGDWINNGTFSSGTGTIAFGGSSAQSITGGAGNPFYNLTTSNNSAVGLTLNNNITVSNILNFNSSGSGLINTGTNTLIISSGTAPTGASAGEYVLGNLQRKINGSGTYLFDIGATSGYTPVSLTFPSGTNSSGSVIVSTKTGEHPNIATSFLDPTKDVNRYWTLVNSGVSGFGTYTAAFTFLTGTPVDKDAGTTTTNFKIENYNASAWNIPTTSGATASVTSASGLSTFGDFAIGEEAVPTPCGPGGNSSISKNILHCINDFASTEITVTSSMAAHQYFTMDVVKGMVYQVYTDDAPGGSDPASRLTLAVYDDAGPNSLVGFSYANSGSNPESSNSNDVFIQFTAPFSGRVRVLLNQRYFCNATTPSGINVYTRVYTGSNTFDNQNAEGTNTWTGHVYLNLNNSGDYTTVFTPYLGYISETEQFTEDFDGAGTCFSLNSNGAVRTQVNTASHFAARFRMNSTRHGLYTVDMGSDDGSRLVVDGQLVYNAWSDHGYYGSFPGPGYPGNLINLNGNSHLQLDFYENGSDNRIAFTNLHLLLANTLSTNLTQSLCSGTLAGLTVSGDSYGTLPSGISVSGTGYQWTYSTSPTGPRTVIAGATGATYTPTATAPFNVPGTYYIFRNAILNSSQNVSSIASDKVTPNYYSPLTATNESSNYLTLTVDSNPFSITTPNLGGASQVCLNSSTPAFTNATGGGTWSILPGTGTAAISAGGVATGLTVGDVTVAYTIKDASNYCSASANSPLSVIALPTIYNVTGGGNYCASETGIYVSLNNSQTGVSYELYKDGNPTGVIVAGTDNTAKTFLLPTPLTSGTYTVVASNTSTGCTSVMTGNAVVVAYDLPDVTSFTVDNAASCLGDTLIFTALPATYANYVFKAGATTLGSGTANILKIASLAPGTYPVTVTAQNDAAHGSCTSTFGPVSVTVNPRPAGIFKAGETSGTVNDNIICAGAEVNLNFSASTYFKYQFYVNTGDTIYSGPNSFFTTTSLADKDSVFVVVTTAAGCSSKFGPIKFTVNPYPDAAGDFTTSSPTVCQAQSAVTYTIPVIANATGYSWSYSGGTGVTITGTSNSVTLNFSAAATSGTLSVMGTNACGNGTAKTLDITVNPLPVAAGTITGTATVCQGTTSVTYTVPTITNATSYTWNYTGTGATYTASTTANSVTIDFATNATSGNLTVKGHDDCGDGIVSANYPVSVSLLPANPGAISGTASLCVGTSGTSYTVPNVADATSYVWTYDGTGATINGSTNPVTIDFSASATSGTLSVQGSNACGVSLVSSTKSIVINPLPTGNITATENSGLVADDGIICAGSSITLTAHLDAGTGSNYQFFLGGNSVYNGPLDHYTTTAINADTTVTVMVTNSNGCVSMLTPFTVTVNALPIVTIDGPNPICLGGIAVYTTEAGQSQYTWNVVGGSVDSAGTATDYGVKVTWTSTGTKTINVNYTDNNGCSAAQLATLTTSPAVVPQLTGTATVCLNTTGITYTTDGDATKSDYTWVITGGSLASGGTTADVSVTVNWDQAAGPHSVSVNYANSDGCGAASPTVLPVTVNPLPTASISTGITVCQNSNPSLTLTGSAGTRAYTFDYNIDGSGTTTVSTTAASNTKTINPVTTTTGSFVYNLIKVTDAKGCSQDLTGISSTVVVTPTPSATISYGSDPSTPLCKTSNAAPVTVTGTPGGTFTASPAGLSINASTGTIDPSSSNTGTFTISYTIAPAGGCAQFTATTRVVITALPTVTISYGASPFCSTVASIPVTSRSGSGAYTGGTYAILPTTGVTINASTGAVTPDASASGDYTVTYSTVASGGCDVVTASAMIHINQAPSATIAYTGTPYCTSLGSAPVSVVSSTGNISGGTYTFTPAGLSLDALTGNINPSASTPGTYSVVYHILASGGCAAAVTSPASVSITAKPVVDAGDAVFTCVGEGAVNITSGAAVTNATSVLWSSNGAGALANPTSLTNATYTQDPGDGLVTLTLTAFGNSGCSSIADTKTFNISANPLPVVIKPGDASFCLGTIQPLTSVKDDVTDGSVTKSSSANLNLNIPDGSLVGVFNKLTVAAGDIPAGAIITSMSISFNITHQADQDLVINIKAPNGRVMNLASSLTGINVITTVSSSASQVIQTGGTAPYTGTWLPTAQSGIPGAISVPLNTQYIPTAFSDLYSQLAGDWTFSVRDGGATQTGKLNSWSLNITYTLPITSVPVTWAPTTDLYSDAAATVPYTGQSIATVYAKPSTYGTKNYIVTSSNAASCSVSDEVTLTVKPSPAVKIQADYCNLANPGKVVLTAVPPDGGSYIFNWNDGTTGVSTQVDEAHDYYVSLTNTQGCAGIGHISVAKELVTNGDFEAGYIPGSFVTEYGYVTDNPASTSELNPEGLFAVDTNAHNFHDNFFGKDHTTPQQTGKFMIVNGYPNATTKIIWQETVPVLPDTRYYYSAWAMNLNNVGPFAKLRFEVNGVQIGTTADLSVAPKPSNVNNVNINNWVRFYYGNEDGWLSSDTATVATIRIIDLEPAAGGNDFGLDDISFATLSPFVTGPATMGTDNQNICSEAPIAPIIYKVGSGATGPTVTGLPDGVVASFDDGLNLVISGTPTAAAAGTSGMTYHYVVATGGSCANPKADTGMIVVRPSATMNLTSPVSSKNQTTCIGTAIVPITYSIGGGATNATTLATSLPAGVFADYNTGTKVFTISGVPTVSGTFTFIVNTTGTCVQKADTGTITISAASAGGTVDGNTVCLGEDATLTLSGNIGNIVRWELSADGGTSWSPVANTSTTLTYTINGPSKFRAVSQISTCAVSYSDGGDVQVNNLWAGNVNSSWLLASNWSSGNMPNINGCTSTITIPKGTPHDPVLVTTIPVTNIHILSNGNLTVTNPGKLQVAQAITTDAGGILDAGNGTIEYNGNASQTIAAGTFLNNAIRDFLISNPSASGVTLAGPIDVYGSLTFSAGGKKLSTGDQLTIKSTATQTAWVGNMTGHTISGSATVERYINTTRKWQLLAVPTQTGQTIHEAWQENQAPGVVGVAGFGTNISGPTGSGLDFISPQYSLKYYDYTINDFKTINNTLQAFPNKDNGYFLFVRGDRQALGSGGAQVPTVMRSKGALNAGNYPVTVPANTFYSIGNPYASRIEFDKITGAAAFGNTFYVWDPLLSGSYGVGGYQTISAANAYQPTAPGTGYYQNGVAYPNIESGQAVYVNNSTAAPITLTFNENAKNSGSNLVFRGEAPADRQFFRTYLFTASGNIADGNAVVFDAQFKNGVDHDDALKIQNSGENLGLSRDGQLLSVETRRPVDASDTLYFNTKNFSQQTYHLRFEPENMAADKLNAYLLDNYLHTSTPVSLTGKTEVDVTVNGDAASANAGRFMVVFKQMEVLPMTFTSIKAYQKDKDIAVEWKVENENGMLPYEVEKSLDGINFTKVATVAANNSGTATYQWIDENASTGYNYYRIRSLDKTGKIMYSTMVRVLMDDGVASIAIYPNPITDGVVHIQLKNQPAGLYGLRLLNPLGQLVTAKQTGHGGGNGSLELKWDYHLAHGIYQLEVTRPDGSMVVIKVLY